MRLALFFNNLRGLEVYKTLKKFVDDGYTLAIFTNQGGIGKSFSGIRAKNFRKYVDEFCTQLNLPILVLAACSDDSCRKPFPGMLDLLEKLVRIKFDRHNSFFCGDAEGGNAFSDSDLKFAESCGITFKRVKSIFGD